MNNTNRFLGILVYVLIASFVFADVPQIITYQGRLLDADNQPINETMRMIFIIYPSEIGGEMLWTSEIQEVKVTDGLFTIQLGVPPMRQLPDNLFYKDTTRFLGITIEGDEEISPRTRLTSSGYAYQALRSDTAGYSAYSLLSGNASTFDGRSVGDFTLDATHQIHLNSTMHHDKTVDASELISGELEDVRLSSNIPRLDANQTFTGENTFPIIRYSNPRTHYYSIASEAFVAGDSDHGYTNTYGIGGAYLHTTDAGALVASVNLPHGANVTNFKVYFNDVSAYDLNVYLQYQSFGVSSYTTMASVKSKGTHGLHSDETSTINYSIIDNINKGYNIYVYGSNWDGGNLMIEGAVITYTIDQAE